MALDGSLQSLRIGDTLGVALLLDISSAGEVAKEGFDESRLAKLDYLNSTISERTISKDVQIVLSNLIDEKAERRPNILKSLDASALVFKEGIGNTFAFARRKSTQQLREDLKEAVVAHRNGDFSKARSLYVDIIKSGGTNRYADIAKALSINLNKQLLLKEECDELVSGLNQLTDIDDILKTYFRLGLLKTQLLNFNQARDYFSKVLDIAPDSDLATKAKFYLGWTNKQAGDLDQSIKYFKDLIQESEQEKLISSSRFQIADAFKRKGDYEKAAELFRDLAHKHGDSAVASTSLMLSKFTYIFDLNDLDKANKITAEVVRDYSGSALLELSREQLEIKQTPFEQLTKVPEGLKGEAITKVWSTVPVLGRALRLGEETAAWYAVYMIEGSIDAALQQNVGKGEILTIDVDPEFLTNYVRKSLNRAAKVVGLSVIGFKLEFPKKDHIRVSGFVKIGPKNFKFYALGKMTLEKHIETDLIKGEYSPQKWIMFTILEGKLGPFNAPVNIANRLTGKAHRVFNQKQVFKIERFSLSRDKIYFAGPLRYAQDELKRQRNLLDRSLILYK